LVGGHLASVVRMASVKKRLRLQEEKLRKKVNHYLAEIRLLPFPTPPPLPFGLPLPLHCTSPATPIRPLVG